jgi:ATP-dependent DNA helicase RecQ
LNPMDKHQQLKQVFGFDEFLSGQETVVDQLLAGHSSAAVFPTGGGKSLCYQLPALMMEGTTIVVSPLIDTLISKGVSAARLDSSLSLEEYRSITQRIRQGELKLLYVAPERFTNERFRAMLNTMNVSLFAIDEAHCISEWGHNFRPDYLKLANFAKDCNANVILALTATATPGVLSDICRFLDVDANHAVRTPFYRSNLTILSDVVSSEDHEVTRSNNCLRHTTKNR